MLIVNPLWERWGFSQAGSIDFKRYNSVTRMHTAKQTSFFLCASTVHDYKCGAVTEILVIFQKFQCQNFVLTGYLSLVIMLFWADSVAVKLQGSVVSKWEATNYLQNNGTHRVWWITNEYADTTECGNLPCSDFLSELGVMLVDFTNNTPHSLQTWGGNGDREIIKSSSTRTYIIALKLSRKHNMAV